jgi:hypothetical protein
VKRFGPREDSQLYRKPASTRNEAMIGQIAKISAGHRSEAFEAISDIPKMRMQSDSGVRSQKNQV